MSLQLLSTAVTGDLAGLQTLPELLAWRARRSPDADAYRQFDAGAQRWVTTSWRAALAAVVRWRDALVAEQLPRGARVAILLPNGLDAVCIDQAALAIGAVPVPLHAIDNAASIAFILADSEAALLVLATLAQWQAIVAVGTPLPQLRRVVLTESAAAAAVVPAAIAMPAPVATVAAPAPPTPVRGADWLAAARAAPHPTPPAADDLAAIVYTSGTTGRPKGVMLTHRNVLANVVAVLERVRPREDDVFLSFLPLSHTFERTGGYYLPIATGSCVAFARSVALLADDLKTMRPTVLVSVPRIYERVYAKLQERLARSSFARRLFAAAQAVGWRRFCRVQRLADPALAADTALRRALDTLAWPLLDRLAARPLRAQFGGRLRVAVSGGAPLSPTIAHAFIGLGLPLLQGYGMTETAPVVAANGLADNDPASVGRALAGVELRMVANRELQVRGPSVMRGYWKRPEDTARVLGADGWLATGDQAEIVDGRLFIRGRIKEIIVTSTGEKVPPGDIELAIAGDALFEQVFVVGDERPFIAAVAVLNGGEWQRLATQLGIDAGDAAALNSAAVQAATLARIEVAAAAMPRVAVPRAVWLTLAPWTIENTLMTPTLKLKRANLAQRFAAEIDALYSRRAAR